MATQITQETLVEKLSRGHPAPRSKLRRLNLAGLYCLFIAALNIVIAYKFSDTVWVKFKLFGF